MIRILSLRIPVSDPVPLPQEVVLRIEKIGEEIPNEWWFCNGPTSTYLWISLLPAFMHIIGHFAVIATGWIQAHAYHVNERQVNFVVFVEWFMNGHQIYLAVWLLGAHFGEQTVHITFQIIIFDDWSITELLDNICNAESCPRESKDWMATNDMALAPAYLQILRSFQRKCHALASIWPGAAAAGTGWKKLMEIVNKHQAVAHYHHILNFSGIRLWNVLRVPLREPVYLGCACAKSLFHAQIMSINHNLSSDFAHIHRS